MLIFEAECLISAAEAEVFDDLLAVLNSEVLPEHGVVAATWHACHALSLLAEADPKVAACLANPRLHKISEISQTDCDALSFWTGRLLPREEPAQTNSAGTTFAIATADSRQAVAILDDLSDVGIVASASRNVKVLWLPSLLDALVVRGTSPNWAASILSQFVSVAGDAWHERDLAAFAWR